ncbi:interference hedgehog-like isoform X2 [Zootermopsis nevadensis]|uniref:interference hedgehog-like isoform X2 n=1 Tax=Zootermopsis nevadensis TaxID=136037 RepID=UPI000B8E5520|nr:interference hedgehog-like isoform X2 [Zootermopsis nevadensis]
MAPQPSTMLVSAVCIWLLLSATRLHAEMGLWFVRSPEPIVAPPGDEVVFECSLNVPAEQVRWRHDGRFLHHNHGNETSSSGLGNHSTKSSHLVVRVHDEHQAGDYQCVAWIGASALASVPARLSLAELRAFPQQSSQQYEVVAGNTVALHCGTPYSNPPALVQYYRNNEKLQVSANMEFLASMGTLILQNVTSQDTGSYHCAATNYITGQTVSSQFNIMLRVVPQGVQEAPHFLNTPCTNYTIQAGSNVTLECSAVGDPPPQVTWHKSGGTIPPNRTELLPGGLHLSHVRKGDEGVYICDMSNGVGQPVRHSAMLYVQEPPVIVKESRNQMVKEGGDMQLDCLVSGSPAPRISWLLNGEPVANDSHVGTTEGKLNITQVEKRHAGIYQCFATNELGSVYGSVMLQVLPKQVTAMPTSDLLPGTGELEEPLDGGVNFATPVPTSGFRGHGRKDHTRKGKGRRKDRKHKGNAVMIPPSRPNITRLTDSSVMVRWGVPPNNGLPIQFFKVQYREMTRTGNSRRRGGGSGARSRGPSQGKGSRWMTNNEDIPPHIRSYEVDGLETDHTYRFRIAAVYSNNDNKLGPNSARFHLHKGPLNNKNPLSPPVLMHTEAVSATAIRICWQYMRSVAVPVEGFYVYYRETSSAGDYIKATVEGEAQRSFVITHLQPDTSYDIKLQSFTVGAASDFSIILTHKTLRVLTETPPLAPEVVSPNMAVGESSNTQLYLVLGAVLGGLLLLVILFLIIFICNRQRSNSQSSQDANEHQDKFSDPALQLETVNVFGLNSKNLLNGCMVQNGFLQNNRMNITSNPLAETDEDKNQNVMEMAYLSRQNNNCSAGSEASASASGASTSGDEGTQPSPSKVNVSEATSWRVVAPDKAAEENYV